MDHRGLASLKHGLDNKSKPQYPDEGGGKQTLWTHIHTLGQADGRSKQRERETGELGTSGLAKAYETKECLWAWHQLYSRGRQRHSRALHPGDLVRYSDFPAEFSERCPESTALCETRNWKVPYPAYLPFPTWPGNIKGQLAGITCFCRACHLGKLFFDAGNSASLSRNPPTEGRALDGQEFDGRRVRVDKASERSWQCPPHYNRGVSTVALSLSCLSVLAPPPPPPPLIRPHPLRSRRRATVCTTTRDQTVWPTITTQSAVPRLEETAYFYGKGEKVSRLSPPNLPRSASSRVCPRRTVPHPSCRACCPPRCGPYKLKNSTPAPTTIIPPSCLLRPAPVYKRGGAGGGREGMVLAVLVVHDGGLVGWIVVEEFTKLRKSE
ncbi:hypothetical protein B0T20DRAFT_390487 [Sordaria brevicollis]|uniref:Uncharacterized protein n=1 Tax=Sordaria brevicollis TaxID=83679 RepID=A0AAE0PII8_SORBR|nr:hypothetical protein B0T20DRAFT_390487 [Sordaria brevicollis]